MPRELLHDRLQQSILADGYDLVIDLNRSQGSRMYDSYSEKSYIDFFSCFASLPIGWNHPDLLELQNEFGRISVNKISNSDLYTEEYASAVEIIKEKSCPSHLDRMFFVSGGSLAVENSMKAAMDWKYQKIDFQPTSSCHSSNQKNDFCWSEDMVNSSKISIGHFREAFHGRSGYTLSVTNTDPNKTKRFSKHKWPRFSNPIIKYPHTIEEDNRLLEVEGDVLEEIRTSAAGNSNLAAVLIEPIQGEGGDNHFTNRFLKDLQEICHEIDALFIVDEVQTGMGATGKMWAFEHAGIEPDIVAFGKKMQVCGMFAGGRLHENEDNVLSTSSRINSTWGGNLIDFVRSAEILKIVERDRLIENTANQGERLLNGLNELSNQYSVISSVRGKGTMCAFTLPNATLRDRYRKLAMDEGVFTLSSGSASIRLRPSLAISSDEVDEALTAFGAAAQKLERELVI